MKVCSSYDVKMKGIKKVSFNLKADHFKVHVVIEHFHKVFYKAISDSREFHKIKKQHCVM